MARRLNRGEVRLVRFPAPEKVRPVVLLTRDASIQHLTRVTVAPVSATIRGVASEVILNEDDGMKKACAVNLHNVTTVAQRDLGKRVAQLSDQRMRQLCAAMSFALGCDP